MTKEPHQPSSAVQECGALSATTDAVFREAYREMLRQQAKGYGELHDLRHSREDLILAGAYFAKLAIPSALELSKIVWPWEDPPTYKQADAPEPDEHERYELLIKAAAMLLAAARLDRNHHAIRKLCADHGLPEDGHAQPHFMLINILKYFEIPLEHVEATLYRILAVTAETNFPSPRALLRCVYRCVATLRFDCQFDSLSDVLCRIIKVSQSGDGRPPGERFDNLNAVAERVIRDYKPASSPQIGQTAISPTASDQPSHCAALAALISKASEGLYFVYDRGSQTYEVIKVQELTINTVTLVEPWTGRVNAGARAWLISHPQSWVEEIYLPESVPQHCRTLAALPAYYTDQPASNIRLTFQSKPSLGTR